MTILNGAMQCAVDYEYIAKNPCARVRLPRAVFKESDIFTREEQSKIERATERSEDMRLLGVKTTLYTGLRLGELCGLKWEYVDLRNGTISVKSSLNRTKNREDGHGKTTLSEQEPKSAKSKRVIPIPRFLCRILREAKEKSKGVYVVHSENGGFVDPRTMQMLYAQLLKTAGVSYRKFHTLRHTFATRAIELGMDVKTLSEILGHASAGVTIDRYVHSLSEQKRKMMDNFESYHNKNEEISANKFKRKPAET
jgi:integrase